MTDPGLTNRLRQHSRRAGLAVGLSMALTIAVCLGGFVWIFAEVDPFLRDFIAAEREPTEPPEPTQETQQAPAQDDDGGEQPDDDSEVAQAPVSEPTPTPTSAPPTPTPDEFRADYQSSSEQAINFRAGPGVNFPAQFALTPAQPLQFLGEQEETQNPEADGLSPGQVWMKFRTEDGTEGWIREIDAFPFDPDA